MMTWFDALLVTVWAAVTLLGARRGLAGGVWAVLGLAVLLLCNALPWSPVATLFALALGFGAAWVVERVFWAVPAQAWHLVVGGGGGFALGGVVVAALALALPIKVIGSSGTYPSDALPAPLYYAVVNSQITQRLSFVWNEGRLVKMFVIPDQARR